jgi:hypothetical protein
MPIIAPHVLLSHCPEFPSSRSDGSDESEPCLAFVTLAALGSFWALRHRTVPDSTPIISSFPRLQPLVSQTQSLADHQSSYTTSHLASPILARVTLARELGASLPHPCPQEAKLSGQAIENRHSHLLTFHQACSDVLGLSCDYQD